MRLVRQPSPNPITGMCDMGFAIEAGDRVALITGEDHRIITTPIIVQPGQARLRIKLPWPGIRELTSLGWGVLDYQGTVICWQWIEPDVWVPLRNRPHNLITVHVDTDSADIRNALN